MFQYKLQSNQSTKNYGINNSRTTSAPNPQPQSYQQRPSSSLMQQPSQNQSYGLATKNPVIMRDLDKPSGIGTQVKITKSV